MDGLNSYNLCEEEIELPPGFRFHPTDEELVTYYLSRKVFDSNFTTIAIGEVDLNKVEPWDLPWKARFGEKEWYFFCLRDRKYPTGSRTNRATEAGYWKATGKDKEIFRAKILVGMKKTLVFYRGRAPKGVKSNWVMHEYRLLQRKDSIITDTTAKNEWVICRVFKKTSGGNKVHISGMVRSSDSRLDLPPLTDLSSDEHATRHSSAAQGPHVTCFSNLKQDQQDRYLAEYTSSSSTNFLYYNSIFSSQLSPCKEIFQCPDSILKQEQKTVCMKENPAVESTHGVSKYEVQLGPYDDDDQDFPNDSTGQIDLDCLWNYEFPNNVDLE